MKLGLKIKSSREKLGMSQFQLSRLCLVSRSHIAKIETEGYLPSISILIKILHHLNMSREFKALDAILN